MADFLAKKARRLKEKASLPLSIAFILKMTGQNAATLPTFLTTGTTPAI